GAGGRRRPRRHRPRRGRRGGQRRRPRALRGRHRPRSRRGPGAGLPRRRRDRPARRVPPHGHRPRGGRGDGARMSGGIGSGTRTALVEAPALDGWELAVSGKVRELYVPAGTPVQEAQEVLVVATDRISAYDYSLQPGIPDKGRILTAMSLFW